MRSAMDDKGRRRGTTPAACTRRIDAHTRPTAKPNEKRLLTSLGTRRKHWLPRRSGPRCCPSAPYMRTPERGTAGDKGSQGARRGGHKLLLIGSFDRRPNIPYTPFDECRRAGARDVLTIVHGAPFSRRCSKERRGPLAGNPEENDQRPNPCYVEPTRHSVMTHGT